MTAQAPYESLTSVATLDELRAAVCGIRIVGEIDGCHVIRRSSAVSLIDQRRAALPERAPVSAADALSLAMRFHETYERLAAADGEMTR